MSATTIANPVSTPAIATSGPDPTAPGQAVDDRIPVPDGAARSDLTTW